MAANKGAGSHFEEAIWRIGVDLKPNLSIVKYDDVRIVENRSGLGSAFEKPEKMEGTGAGVQGRYPQWDETQFLIRRPLVGLDVSELLGRTNPKGSSP